MGMTTETITWHEIKPGEVYELPKDNSEVLIKNKFGQVLSSTYSGRDWFDGSINNAELYPSKWVKFWAYMPKGPQ